MNFTRVMGVALAAIGLAASTASADAPSNRYGFAHGCYSISDANGPIAPASGPFRMQATDLGTYLLYGTHRDFLADPGDGTIAPASAPSPSAEWIVRGSAATGWSITNRGTDKSLRVTFTEADGCAVYPEISTNTVGTPQPSGDPDGPVQGWVDGHMHWMGFELFGGDWHCGKPWDRYGAPYALPDCSKYDIGTNGGVRAVEDGRTPGAPWDSVGWPTFKEWPNPGYLAEEATYYKSVERAWKSGLRVLVVLYVDNEAMCDIMTVTHLPCHDMNSVRVQNDDLNNLVRYVDAQSGGPGKGFLQIATSPTEARHIINDGKLAVVKGIELSRVLDCGETNGKPECDRPQVDDGLRELWHMGVRDFFPVHKFDNGFGGTKGDGGTTGYVVNSGNFHKTGHWWDMRHCDDPVNHDETQTTAPGADELDLVYTQLGAMMQPAMRLPIYGTGPHCNVRGLTDMGRYLINRMIDEHFLIEIDHMDEKTADATMNIVEQRGYAGVVNSHGSWSSPRTIQRILQAGGMSTIGSDVNGLAHQPGTSTVTYPFFSHDGQVEFFKDKWGDRTFDINTDGVAEYGMRADWIQGRIANANDPAAEAHDIFTNRGAERYLEMWQRAWDHQG